MFFYFFYGYGYLHHNLLYSNVLLTTFKVLRFVFYFFGLPSFALF